MRRVEGYWGVLSLTQVLLGVTFPFGFSLCAIFAVAAGYRPERNPDVTQALNDVFWFIFVGLVGPLITQVVILAVVVLFLDKREVPSFPRWFGYFNIWYAVLGVPGCADLSVQDGTTGVERSVRILDSSHGVLPSGRVVTVGDARQGSRRRGG